jgi:hypothetical protein
VRATRSLMLMVSIFLATTLSLANLAEAKPSIVTASVDKNPVLADESFNLVITANDDVDSAEFDPAPLLKDFVVGRTSVSTQTQMINFNTTRSTTWTTVLIPRKQGRFTIPAFKVDGETTQAIDVMVLPVSASSSSQGRDIYVTTELDVNEAYLQQQIRYTVKLFLGKDLQRGSLANPSLANADIRQIGKDKEYNDIVDGRRYRIIERTFAIIPQQSGTFTIEGPLFEGEVVDNSRQSFGFFNRSTPVNRVGPSQKISVLPIPANYPDHWLPSDFVQVNEEWQGDPSQYHAGEPITRTITLTAIGVVEEQLPAIDSQYPSWVKTYPDQPETFTVERDNSLVAQRKESIAIIPGEAGTLVIPEVRVPWFNVLTKKTEYTVLPEKVLQILPANTQTSAPLPALPIEQTDSTALTTKPNELEQGQGQGTPSVDEKWRYISLSLLILWLMTLLVWAGQHRLAKKRQGPTKTQSSELADTALWGQLVKAIKQGDSRQVQQTLPIWLSRVSGKKHNNLSAALRYMNDPVLQEAVEAMLGALYSQTPSKWQPEALMQALQVYRPGKHQALSKEGDLNPLYPA